MVNRKRKEDIVCYEEIGICNVASTYEEVGIPNDSVHYEKLGSSNNAAEYEEMGISNNTTGHYQEMSTFSVPKLYDEIGALKKADENWTDQAFKKRVVGRFRSIEKAGSCSFSKW